MRDHVELGHPNTNCTGRGCGQETSFCCIKALRLVAAFVKNKDSHTFEKGDAQQTARELLGIQHIEGGSRRSLQIPKYSLLVVWGKLVCTAPSPPLKNVTSQGLAC